MRYLYIKNGDVIDQYERIIADRTTPRKSGPEAFLGDFLYRSKQSNIVLVGKGSRNARCKKNGIELVTMAGARGLVSGPVQGIRDYLYVFFKIISISPDRIICGRVGPMLWAAVGAARLMGVPCVHSRHNYHAFRRSNLLGRLKERLDKVCLRRVDAIVCHGPYLKSELVKEGVLEATIVEFDVDVSEYFLGSGENVDVRRSNREKTILYVGRIERQKGVFDLLDAMGDQLKVDGRARLIYVGRGDALGELEEAVRMRELNGDVEFVGYQDRDGIRQYFRKAMVVVTPTRAAFPEGRCMVAMEALASGVPVVAPNFGPFPYLIENGINGLLYSPDSVRELGECLVGLLRDDAAIEKLQTGAKRLSRRVVSSQRSFGEAVQEAFELCQT